MAIEERITFAAGNFWGVEASFRNEHEVLATRVGYMGGEVDDPTDEEVAVGSTGHAEVVEVTFDAERRPLQFMLEWFWQIHDPTQVARYSPKVGHKHRSAIFCHTPEQEAEAIAWLEAKQACSSAPLLTEIRRATTFWLAGPEHQRRLERMGAFEAGRLPDDLEPYPMQGLSNPGDFVWCCRVDLDLAERAGAAFSPHFHGDVLRRVFDGEQRHVDAAVGELRRSSAASPPEAVSEPSPVWHSAMAMYTWAMETRLRWSLDGREHEFIVNLAPGSHMARPVIPGHERLRSVYLCPAQDPADAGLGYSGGSPTQRLRPGFAVRPTRGPRQETSERAIGTWYEHIPPVEAALDVLDGEPHRVSWQAGELEFMAHDDRVDGERTLRALGASVCPCFYILAIWHPGWLSQRWRDQPVPDMLGLWYASDPLAQVDGDDHAVWWQPERWAKRFARPAPPLPDPNLVGSPNSWPDGLERRAVFARVDMALRRMPQPLKFRWFLGSLDALEQHRHELNRWDRANLQHLSLRPLQGAISCSLWKWCRFEPEIEYGSLTCRLLEWGAPAQVEGYIDGGMATMAVAVPFRWLTHVWARGLAVIDDQLVLDVQGPSESSALAAVVATWETVGGATRLVTRDDTASWDGTEWHLT